LGATAARWQPSRPPRTTGESPSAALLPSKPNTPSPMFRHTPKVQCPWHKPKTKPILERKLQTDCPTPPKPILPFQSMAPATQHHGPPCTTFHHLSPCFNTYKPAGRDCNSRKCPFSLRRNTWPLPEYSTQGSKGSGAFSSLPNGLG
jgi:hypothetical protein